MSEEDKLGILAGLTFVLSPEQYTEYKKTLNEQIIDLQKQLNKQKEVLDKIKEYIETTDTFQLIHSTNGLGEKLREKTKKDLLKLLEEIK